MRTSHLLTGLFILLIGVAGGFALSQRSGSEASQTDPDSEGAPEIAAEDLQVAVRTVRVEIADLPLSVEAIGRIEPDRDALRTLSSRAGGRVLSTSCAPGQIISPGDAILQFDPAPLAAVVSQSQSQLERAQEQWLLFEDSGRRRRAAELAMAEALATTESELAAAQWIRLETLFDEGLTSEKALATARQAAEQAVRDRELASRAVGDWASHGADLRRATLSAEKEAAIAALAEALADQSAAEVVAPSGGIVLSFSVVPGDRFEPGAALGTLLVDSRQWLIFGVAPGVRIERGATAHWVTPSGIRRTGSVVRTSPAISPTTGLVEVVVEPEKGVPTEPLGVRVRGDLEVGRITRAVVVPAEAIVRSDDVQVIRTVGPDGLAHEIAVRVVGRSEGLVAVEGEVQGGERVIIEGSYNLPDGARVIESSIEERTVTGSDR